MLSSSVLRQITPTTSGEPPVVLASLCKIIDEHSEDRFGDEMASLLSCNILPRTVVEIRRGVGEARSLLKEVPSLSYSALFKISKLLFKLQPGVLDG